MLVKYIFVKAQAICRDRTDDLHLTMVALYLSELRRQDTLHILPNFRHVENALN